MGDTSSWLSPCCLLQALGAARFPGFCHPGRTRQQPLLSLFQAAPAQNLFIHSVMDGISKDQAFPISQSLSPFLYPSSQNSAKLLGLRGPRFPAGVQAVLARAPSRALSVCISRPLLAIFRKGEMPGPGEQALVSREM